jgi:CRP-like cAMP-binding protein
MADLRKLKDRAAELAAKGKLEKAADLYREALEGDPKDVATRQKLAEVLRRAGRTGEAIVAYGAVADRFARDGLLIKAIAISKTILELDPGHVATQATLADLYAKRAIAEGTRPPPRTVVMAAIRPPGAGPVPGALVPPPPPDLEDRVVAIPLALPALPPPPPAEGAPRQLPAEAGPAPGPRRPPVRPAAAPPPTAFARIVLAAGDAVAAGVEEEIVLDLEAEAESFPFEVTGNEPAPPPAEPPASPVPPAPRTPPPAAEPPVRPAPPRLARPAPPPPAAHAPPRVAASPPSPARAPAPPAAAGLPRFPIFSDLSREAFVALTRAMALRRAGEGEVVLREGDTGTSFYVVATGRLAVSKRDERGEAVVLARLGEGDFFGEMALLSGAPRAATVVAEEPSELLEFGADALLEIARSHPHLADSLRRFYRQRLLANAMAVSPVFRPFPKGDRKLIMERFRAREVSAGETIVREGEPSDGLYVVLEGTVEVVKRKDGATLVIGELREGDLFGEMSCLRKAPASATVVVRRGGTLLKLPRRDFDDLVVSYPQILELVAELSEERSENLDAILSGHAQWTDEGLVLV